MSCEGKCELVEFKVTASRFIHIEPRPRSDAPADLEQRLEVRGEGRGGDVAPHLRVETAATASSASRWRCSRASRS